MLELEITVKSNFLKDVKEKIYLKKTEDLDEA